MKTCCFAGSRCKHPLRLELGQELLVGLGVGRVEPQDLFYSDDGRLGVTRFQLNFAQLIEQLDRFFLPFLLHIQAGQPIDEPRFSRTLRGQVLEDAQQLGPAAALGQLDQIPITALRFWTYAASEMAIQPPMS